MPFFPYGPLIKIAADMGSPPTFASHPGGLTLSRDKLLFLQPELRGLGGLRHKWQFFRTFYELPEAFVEEHLRHGDGRAAVVVSVSPLLVAAYTDELDCVALLHFPERLIEIFGLAVGTRLLTTNSYRQASSLDPDLLPGEYHHGRFTGFIPVIADFLTDDVPRLQWRKATIAEWEWGRAAAMGKNYLLQFSGVARDGRPYWSGVSARRPA